ncbi:MAG: hypothetical protein UX39_C0001G0033 [Candidatus Magasanikbacteria bacterium GW2011_GWA2_46_17]|uniref:Uncharacterized protein n=1 Tax=Candidatus Magasanikbacteria bacterium GW2011_GWA2_46_17 TaxID=1619042 RepID=A0A0G1RBB9_9BACT|nr:MAG: hypothetical protein UX39_C0001G0033 [Candidatus Magasanikbacteria bacterium GW2011_GWA2_46_17]
MSKETRGFPRDNRLGKLGVDLRGLGWGDVKVQEGIKKLQEALASDDPGVAREADVTIKNLDNLIEHLRSLKQSQSEPLEPTEPLEPSPSVPISEQIIEVRDEIGRVLERIDTQSSK